MRETVKNHKLMQYAREISQMEQQGGVLAKWHRTRISEFKDKNGHNVFHLEKELDKIRNDFFIFEEPADNQPAQVKYEGEGKDRKPVFQEGKDQEQYEKVVTELMETNVSVIF